MKKWCSATIFMHEGGLMFFSCEIEAPVYLANAALPPSPRRVAALVSVPDDKVQIILLILGRGALSTYLLPPFPKFSFNPSWRGNFSLKLLKVRQVDQFEKHVKISMYYFRIKRNNSTFKLRLRRFCL